VKLEQDGGMIVVARFVRKVGTRVILGGDRAQSERTDILASRQLGFGQHLRPGEYGHPGKQRRYVAPAIDRGNVKGVGEPVERKRASERDHMTAVDQPAAKATLALGERVEMNTSTVLIEPRGDLVLGLLYRDAVHVIDLSAHGIIGKAEGTAGKSKIVRPDI